MALEESELAQPRAKKEGGSGCMYWVLGCAGVSVIVGLLCCGGIGYVTTNVMSTKVELKLRDNAQIREELGELSSVRINFLKSTTRNDSDVWVYDLSGAKGKGELTIQRTADFENDQNFRTATLRLSDGKTVEIDLNPEAVDPEPETPPDDVPPVSAPVVTEPEKTETSPMP